MHQIMTRFKNPKLENIFNACEICSIWYNVEMELVLENHEMNNILWSTIYRHWKLFFKTKLGMNKKPVYKKQRFAKFKTYIRVIYDVFNDWHIKTFPSNG